MLVAQAKERTKTSMIHPIKHFCVITRHRHKVVYNCFRAGILWRGLLHDLSKYTPVEFIPGAKYFQGTRSPNEVEREKFGYSKAWLHHKGRNRHHFEYWTDYNPVSKTVEPVDMPDIFIIEMFCDRVAASKIYGGENYTDEYPLNYFLKSKVTRIITKTTSDKIEFLLRYLNEHGEKETFKYIRKNKNNLLAGEEM